MTHRFAVLFALCCAVMAQAHASPDSDYAQGPKTYLTPALGGRGGTPFRIECQDRDFLVGVHVRFDGWMDQIDGFCAMHRAGAFIPSAKEIMAPGFNAPKESGWSGRYGTGGAAAGGDGGRAEAVLMCPQGMLVTNLNAGRSPQSGMLANAVITCSEIGTGGTQTIHQNPQVFGPEEAGWIPSQGCTSDTLWYYAARGLHGRAGSHVDAVGLVCAAFRDGLYERPADQRRAEAAARQADMDKKLRRGAEDGGVPRIGDGRFGDNAIRQGPRLDVTGRPGREIADTVRHDFPTLRRSGRERIVLDWCLRWGEACGKPAANAFCAERDPDRPYAADFSMAPDIGRTQIISTSQICRDPACDGFAHITCTNQPAANVPPR